MWFSSELNGKDHLESIHNFKEGQGYSFYDCLRQFGLEWFGRRSFFDQRDVTGQWLWMDLALARRSGQALHNSYTITNSPALSPLRKFFCAAVRNLTSAYENRAYTQAEGETQPSICAQMRWDISQDSHGHIDSTDLDPAFDIPVVESLSPLIISYTTPPLVVDAPLRSITPNNRSLTYLQSGPFHPQSYLPQARGGGRIERVARKLRPSMLCGTVATRPVSFPQC